MSKNMKKIYQICNLKILKTAKNDYFSMIFTISINIYLGKNDDWRIDIFFNAITMFVQLNA